MRKLSRNELAWIGYQLGIRRVYQDADGRVHIYTLCDSTLLFAMQLKWAMEAAGFVDVKCCGGMADESIIPADKKWCAYVYDVHGVYPDSDPLHLDEIEPDHIESATDGRCVADTIGLIDEPLPYTKEKMEKDVAATEQTGAEKKQSDTTKVTIKLNDTVTTFDIKLNDTVTTFGIKHMEPIQNGTTIKMKPHMAVCDARSFPRRTARARKRPWETR